MRLGAGWEQSTQPVGFWVAPAGWGNTDPLGSAEMRFLGFGEGPGFRLI